MYVSMLLTAVSAGKQASFAIVQFIQYNLEIYGLHNLNLDVRDTFIPTMQKGVIQEKQTIAESFFFDITQWYSSGRHIATYLSYAMTERIDRSLKTNEMIT